MISRCFIFCPWSVAMIQVSLLLYTLTAAGIAAMAAKYVFGQVPAPHHREALEKDGVSPGQNVVIMLRGIYLAFAGALLAVAILIAYMAYVPVRAGDGYARLMLLLAGLVVGTMTTYGAWQFEKRTGIASPWKIAAGLTVLVVLATLSAGT
jgi:hypothetical protein